MADANIVKINLEYMRLQF